MDLVTQRIESKHAPAFAEGTIHASVGEVWLFIGAIGAEKIFIPGVLKSELVEGHGLGSRRKIKVKEGILYERVVDYEPDQYRMAYEPEEGHPFPGKGIFGVVKPKALGSDVTQVTWSTFFDPIEPSAEEALRERSTNRFKGAIVALAKLAEG